jgi:hypothetical protein
VPNEPGDNQEVAATIVAIGMDVHEPTGVVTVQLHYEVHRLHGPPRREVTPVLAMTPDAARRLAQRLEAAAAGHREPPDEGRTH